MAFDQTTRNRLAHFVSNARALLTEEFSRQLQQEYGLDPLSGEETPMQRLAVLDDTRRETARILRETLNYYLAGKEANPRNRIETLDRILREQAFTVLNRLCALRMSEARELVLESVANGYLSKGFQLYARLAGSALGGTGEAYRAYLFSLMDEFAVDLPVLFDRFSPQGRLFPREGTLLKLLDLLNDAEIEPLWAEDETIGWIYQYFNSKEERKAMRDASQAPRNSRELAVRNQFFTPRYVVEFLTDNTLGRIWYEMTHGETSLKDTCHYLVRRPTEIFLNEGESVPEQAETGEDLSQEELLRQPVNIPHRPMKDPREIKMLDPACGSMHFGLYAFDLFETIYEEAWQKNQVPAEDFGYRAQAEMLLPTVRLNPTRPANSNYGDYRIPVPEAWVVMTYQGDFGDGVNAGELYIVKESTRFRVPFDYRVPLAGFDVQLALKTGLLDAARAADWVRQAGCFDYVELPAVSRDEAYDHYRRETPRLIIEHNIHGVDIDPRAVQIAGLSLWLRAQRSWQAQGLRPAERPQICKSNVVCAEPMPGDRAMLEEFLGTLQGERLEALMRVAWQVPAHRRVRATVQMAEALASLVRKVWDEMELAGEAGSLLKIEETLRAAIETARQAAVERSPLFRVLEFGMDEAPREDLLQLVSGTEQSFFERAEELVLAALQEYAKQAENGVGYRRRLFAGDAARGFAFIDLCQKRYDVVLMNPPFGLAPTEGLNYARNAYPNSFTELLATFVERGCAFSNGRVGAITSRSFMVASRLKNWRRETVANKICLLADLGDNVMDNAFVEAAAYVLDERTTSLLAFDCRNTDSEDIVLRNKCLFEVTENIFYLDTSLFTSFPNNRIIYSIDPKIAHLLQNKVKFEPSAGTARQGLATWDDFRFVRLAWEVPPFLIGKDRMWEYLAKGGAFSRYLCNVHLLMKWHKDGAESSAINIAKNGTDAQARQASIYWRRPGITYSIRSQKGFSARILPKGCLFTGQGPLIVSESEISNLYLIGWINSSLITTLIEIQSNDGKYMSGLLKSLPWQQPTKDTINELEEKTRLLICSLITFDSSFTEISPYFKNLFFQNSLIDTHKKYIEDYQQTIKDVLRLDADWNRYIFHLYGVDEKHINKLREQISFSNINEEGDEEISGNDCLSIEQYCKKILSYLFGISIGRWNIRFTKTNKVNNIDVFDPLPISPPGILMCTEELVQKPNYPSTNYPIHIPLHGILVDDESNINNILLNVRECLLFFWGNQSESIEQEFCSILGLKTLNEYFKAPNQFFSDHFALYSKSRRAAPIYWPLSTPSCSYILWLYYHRLNDQTLYTCVNDFVDPKLKQVSEEAARLRQKQGRSAADEKELERLTDFEHELQDFREELLRVAKFWKPNLNDGVEITAAPLWKLFQHRPWQKRLKETWGKLEAGEYDWAHLAFSIWPERVREKCKSDKSLAIAHDLEALYVEPPVTGKKKKVKYEEIGDELDL